MLENKQMLYELVQQPDLFLEHIRRYSNALTTSMIFGWRTPTYRDEKMMQLFDGVEKFTEINQAGVAALLDSFPLLRYLPDFMMPLKKRAKLLHAKERELYLSHWLKAKDDLANGIIHPCFSVGLAESQKQEGFSDDQACYITGTLLEAGSDTTAATVYGFMQAMLLYPDVQKRAQAEIDRVIGEDRLPTMDDDTSLQYIRAIMKETMRWMPTAVTGAVPHAVIEDDYYNGYLIPKGAGIVNNVWSIHMDPKQHPDPRRFDPERYVNDLQSMADSAANANAGMRDHFNFGSGRRICQGIHVAERSLFLAMSRILWGFHIEPALDAAGKPIIPDPGRLTQGFICMPEEFPAKITPRSEARKQKIIQEYEEAVAACLDPVTKQWREPVKVKAIWQPKK